MASNTLSGGGGGSSCGSGTDALPSGMLVTLRSTLASVKCS